MEGDPKERPRDAHAAATWGRRHADAPLAPASVLPACGFSVSKTLNP